MPYKDLVKRKEKHRGYAKKWRASHLEQAREADKRQYEKNKEKKRARDHKRRTTEEYRKQHREDMCRWRAEHPEEARIISTMASRCRRLKYPSKWVKQSPEDKKCYQHSWYIKHQERKGEQSRQWREEHPERVKVLASKNSHCRMARLRNVPWESFTIEDIATRDGHKCGICRKKVKKDEFSFDHIIPVKYGGAHTMNNVQLAHRRCNSRRGAGYLPGQLRF